MGGDNLLQTTNQIVHLSEEMVFHGSEGHLHEIVDYGEKIIIEINQITRALKNSKRPNQKELQKTVRETRDKTASAIRAGRQGNLSASLSFAKSASFQAKKIRQALR
jgi:predicted translin family RNA/ssDNA-binding protein